MAAHLRDLPCCDSPSCDRTAVVELRNTYNAHMGNYCRAHGRAALATLLRQETKA